MFSSSVEVASETSPPASGRRSTAQSSAILTAEREQELAARIQAGDPKAREELIVANLRLVRSIAAEFRARNRAIDLDDLIQEGNIGLMRAVRDFDPEAHGTRFVTYASCWIRHHIQRVLAEQSSLIRFPYYVVVLRRRFEKVRAQMVEALRAAPASVDPMEPSMEEVAERMGVAPRRLKHLRNAQVDLRSYSTTSLDDDESQDDALSQLLPPESPLEIAETMERLHAAMRRLTLLEAWVLRRRYRLDDSTEEVVDEAASRVRRRGAEARRPGPRTGGRRTYRELSHEIGKPIHQLRQVERAAIVKLHEILDGAVAAEGEVLEAPANPRRHAPAPARRSA
ncbi:sigma-70 family RNA polymerase sigma factor [Planctomyces sp. SH-PL62]|uniref:sigma-70 family RNA polymerase sigma factor n=1 Tax=Planctomyces sp. SH-PL62 TaxID=1636152 RepID=UPI00078EB142|nr:sigma-70 family RNA polymerase sigma factor [Planctomyces sp. SH-PL62]AMV37381.1 RNA polymerase sigma factor SigA [Planctomyces sp. SH-PL62]